MTVQGFSICADAYVSDNVTSTCSITTAPAVVVTRTCPAAPIRYGETVSFTAMVLNSGNVTLTNVTVVNSMPAANTPVFGPLTLAPGQGTNFTFSYTAPLNCNCCELIDTLTVRGQDRCTGRSVATTFHLRVQVRDASASAREPGLPGRGNASGRSRILRRHGDEPRRLLADQRPCG